MQCLFVFRELISITVWLRFQMAPMRLVARRANDCKNIHKDVYNIQIQIQCSKNVLFRTYAVLVLTSHHKLCVVNQIDTEQKSTGTCIDDCDGLSWEENGDDSEQHQYNNGNEQNSTHHGEIPFRLEREKRQAETNRCRYAYCQKYLKLHVMK